MSQAIPPQILQQLLVAYLAMGKSEFSDEQLAALQTGPLPRYLGLVSEVAPLEALVDKSLIRHALHSLAAGNSAEETVMYSFMLYVYTLLKSGKVHPLEMGIIRQKINGLLPIFESAKQQQLIRTEVFEYNAALLQAIADQTNEASHAIGILAAGYSKYA